MLALLVCRVTETQAGQLWQLPDCLLQVAPSPAYPSGCGVRG